MSVPPSQAPGQSAVVSACTDGRSAEERRFYSPERVLEMIGERGNPEIREELSLIRPVSIKADMLKVLEVFRDNRGESFFPVLDETHAPVGLLREEELKGYVYAKYGQALLSHPEKRRDVSRFVTACPAVDLEISTDDLLEAAFAGQSEGVIVTADGRYIGFIRLNSIVKLAHQRQMRLIEQHNQELDQKNRDIQNMLHNMRQGIFTILPDLSVHPEYSAHLEAIYERQGLAGCSALELLFARSELSADRISQIEAALGAMLGEDRLMYELNSHLLCGEYELRLDSGCKILELHWNPIVDEQETVEKIMVVVRDVTEVRGLRAEADARKRELELLEQILAVPERRFLDFLAGSRAFLDDNRRLLERTGARGESDLETLFRNMHTIKGNARTLGFTLLGDDVHRAEQSYDAIRRGEAEFDRERLLDEIARVGAVLDEYEQSYRRKLKSFSGERSDGVFLDRRLIAELREILGKAGDAADSARISRFLQALDSLPLSEALADSLAALPSLAAELGKPAPRVRLYDSGVRVRPNLASVLASCFNHLLRNALDHGLEPAAARRERGKPEQGLLTIEAVAAENGIRIEFADDGRGLALPSIRAKAIMAGLLAADAQASDETLAEFIFHSGLSTADSLTAISGRGVGMDAVRRLLNEQGGDIQLRFTGPATDDGCRPFVFTLVLPAGAALSL